jgi:hypothetical protein
VFFNATADASVGILVFWGVVAYQKNSRFFAADLEIRHHIPPKGHVLTVFCSVFLWTPLIPNNRLIRAILV